MKKWMSFIIVVLMFSFVGCGGEENDETNDENNQGNDMSHVADEEEVPDSGQVPDNGQVLQDEKETVDEQIVDEQETPDEVVEDIPVIDETNEVPDEEQAEPASMIINHKHRNIHEIPAEAIERAKSTLHIAYNHTSHGSQLITGMNSLKDFPLYGDTYAWASRGGSTVLDLRDRGIGGIADLSQGDSIDENGVTPWVTATRSFLDNPDNNEINVIMWSWCNGGNHDIDRYIDNMEILISEYSEGGSKPRAADHPVTFVFMTAHANGDGESTSPGAVHLLNEAVRAHCEENNRVLFDFGDIEAYDPDGEYYWDMGMRDNLHYDGGNWGVEWIAENPTSELAQLTTGNGVDGFSGTSGCAHSSDPQEANINCVLKGSAAWWMFARIAGWDGR